jgi:hypothetical protein
LRQRYRHFSGNLFNIPSYLREYQQEERDPSIRAKAAIYRPVRWEFSCYRRTGDGKGA